MINPNGIDYKKIKKAKESDLDELFTEIFGAFEDLAASYEAATMYDTVEFNDRINRAIKEFY